MSTQNGGRGGAFVKLSSAGSCLGSLYEYVDYAASEGAIDTFTLGLAPDVGADGIRVNAVRPGIFDTDLHAAGGEPDRVGRLKASVPRLRGSHSVAFVFEDAFYSQNTVRCDRGR